MFPQLKKKLIVILDSEERARYDNQIARDDEELAKRLALEEEYDLLPTLGDADLGNGIFKTEIIIYFPRSKLTGQQLSKNYRFRFPVVFFDLTRVNYCF